LKHFYTSKRGVRHSWERGDDGIMRILSSQDVESMLDTAKAMANHNDGYSPSRELRRVAVIPPVIQLKWMNEYGVDPLHPDHNDLLCRLLNDPDYAFLRTAPGQLGMSNGAMH
jgi:hypothetical protein